MKKAWAVAAGAYWGDNINLLPAAKPKLKDFEITALPQTDERYDLKAVVGYDRKDHTILVGFRGTTASDGNMRLWNDCGNQAMV